MRTVNIYITHYNIAHCTDTKKMPLGKLSKSQIAKGFEVTIYQLLLMVTIEGMTSGTGGD